MHTVLFLGDYLHIHIYNCFSKKISDHSDDEEEKRDMWHEGMMQLQSKFGYLLFPTPPIKLKLVLPIGG